MEFPSDWQLCCGQKEHMEAEVMFGLYSVHTLSALSVSCTLSEDSLMPETK